VYNSVIRHNSIEAKCMVTLPASVAKTFANMMERVQLILEYTEITSINKS
jgi:hypothetical protein